MKQEIVVPGERAILRKTFFFFFFQEKPERVKGISMWISQKGELKKQGTQSEKKLVFEPSVVFEDCMETSVATMRLREVGNEVTRQSKDGNIVLVFWISFCVRWEATRWFWIDNQYVIIYKKHLFGCCLTKYTVGGEKYRTFKGSLREEG